VDQKIVWSLTAASNLENICKFIAKDSTSYASLFGQRIVEIIESLSVFPKAGRVVPEYKNENIRERFYKSYRIVYRIRPSYIEVVAIVNFARHLEP